MFHTAEERAGIAKLVVACRKYPGKTPRREQERVNTSRRICTPGTFRNRWRRSKHNV